MLFKKKKVVDKVKDDREFIETNSKSIEAIVVLAKDNEEIIQDLKELQETLKYLIPSAESSVIDCDKKIKNKIGDLKIALTKSDGETSKKAAEVLMEVKLAIAERNAKI